MLPLVLEIMFTHPEHRRRGAGTILMDWGVKLADQLGLESFIQASEMGKLLYLRHGYLVLEESNYKPELEEKDKSDEWKMLEKKVGPMFNCVMWRPAATGQPAR
jgi:hypothetical protein